MTFDGLRRLGWAVLSAGLDGLAARLLRASDTFLTSGRLTPAKAALSLATALLKASERASGVAFPKARA
jgi:hypothetical protein